MKWTRRSNWCLLSAAVAGALLLALVLPGCQPQPGPKPKKKEEAGQEGQDGGAA